PGNVIILADGATDELFSNLGYSDVSNIEREAAKSDEDGRPLQQPLVLDSVDRYGKSRPLCSWETYVIVNQPVPVEPGQTARRRFVQVRGIVDPDISARVHNLSLLPGGAWFSEAGVQAAPAEHETKEDYTQAVLGQSVARELGRDQKK